jgi:hypothetical protein
MKGQEKDTNFGWNRQPFSADKIRGIEPLACYSDGGANPLSRAQVNESASAIARPICALLEATHSVAICERLDFTPLQTFGFCDGVFCWLLTAVTQDENFSTLPSLGMSHALGRMGSELVFFQKNVTIFSMT